MLVHLCIKCGKININRIAADDNTEKILEVLDISKALDQEILEKLKQNDIELLTDKDLLQIRTQLFGR